VISGEEREEKMKRERGEGPAPFSNLKTCFSRGRPSTSAVTKEKNATLRKEGPREMDAESLKISPQGGGKAAGDWYSFKG